MRAKLLSVRLPALLLCLLLLAGCVPASTPPSSAPEPETVTAEPAAGALPELTLLTPVPEQEPAPSGTPLSEETPAPTAEEHANDSKSKHRDDVALYLHIYGHLPDNFISKTKARKLGWSGGSLEPYAPGKCIGGGEYQNLEGLLPEAPGRVYHECDIDTLGKKSRGAKRIVWSNDGLIYYTDDHYESFTLLYGEE